MMRARQKKLALVTEDIGIGGSLSAPSSGSPAKEYRIEPIANPMGGCQQPSNGTVRRPWSLPSLYRRTRASTRALVSMSASTPATVSALAAAPVSFLTSDPASISAPASILAPASTQVSASTPAPSSSPISASAVALTPAPALAPALVPVPTLDPSSTPTRAPVLAPASAPAPATVDSVACIPMSENSVAGDVQCKRRGRGPNIKDSALPPKGTKWICKWEGGLPTGDIGGKLATLLGTFARKGNYFPLHLEWGQWHNQSWEIVWTELQNYFTWVGPEDPSNPQEAQPVDLRIVRHWCKDSLQKKVRDWRARVKKEYYDVWVDMTPEQRESMKVDKRIQEDDWKKLIEYFEQDKKKDEIARNSMNRGKDRVIHTTGSRSMMRAKEKWKEELGSEYNTLVGYMMAHKKQKGHGDYPDVKTRAFCEAVSQKCHELSLTQSTEPFVLAPALDAVFHGHHGGYERGVGVGYSRRLMRESTEGHSTYKPSNPLESVVQSLQKQNSELTERLHSMERLLEEILHREREEGAGSS